jgi:hypothetical protein
MGDQQPAPLENVVVRRFVDIGVAEQRPPQVAVVI